MRSGLLTLGVIMLLGGLDLMPEPWLAHWWVVNIGILLITCTLSISLIRIEQKASAK